MAKRPDTSIDHLARMTAAEFARVHAEVKDIREQMVTKDDLEVLPTIGELKDMEDRLVTHLKDIKAGVKQVVADEAANTVAIARLDERLTKLEKRVGSRK